jgi:hypothetical protein
MVFFSFPADARWNDGQGAVEFTVSLGEYQGTVPVHRRVFQRLFDQSPTPERCLEAFHLQRTRFELAVERKLRRRQLTDDGNVEITGRDLRERDPGTRLNTSAFVRRREASDVEAQLVFRVTVPNDGFPCRIGLSGLQ